jgi:CRP/FNR family cyclic AMP-dependent transcriptional regulator
MTTPPITLLQDVPLFAELTPGELGLIATFIHMQTFPSGTNLLTSDQPGEVAYIIMSGAVKVCIEHAGGKDVILAILGPGEIVGEMSLIDHMARSATAVTLEECSTLWIDRAGFWKCLETVPAMNYNLARILSRRLRLTNAHIQSLAALDLYGRVARQIVMFAQEYGQPLSTPKGAIHIPFRLTQSDISDLVGASRGRVNQVLGSFKERGFVTVDHGHRITAVNVKGLISLYE